MNPLLQNLLRQYMAPAGDGADLGGAVDRGDDFDSMDPDEPEEVEKKPEPKAADEDDIDPEDPDGELKEGEEAEKKADKPKKDSRIPLSRHKELLEKERAKRADLERQLAQFQKGGEVAALNENITKAEDDILNLEKEYNTLLADGELDKASAKMTEIRRLERQINESRSDMKIAAAEARATERARYNIALERIESVYPELNPDDDTYDEELMQDVVDLKAAYESRRNMTPTEAMQAAVRKLLGTRTKSQEKALDTTPRVSDKDVANEVRAERKKDAVTKAVKAVEKQPPSTAKVGLDSDKAGGGLSAKDVLKMSQEDFRKLPEEVLARMRGDEVGA